MPISGHHFIAGTPSTEGHQTFTSVNPRTKTPGDVQFFNATPSEIDRAVSAAVEAFKITRNYSASRLAEFLERVAAEIEALGDEWLNTADMETGLGLTRLTGERARTTGQLRAFANLLREGSYVEAIIDTATADRPDIRRMLFPIGPVAVFAASNFPFAFSVAGGDTASAFAAGCPVIVKAHPGHPATSELAALAINRAIVACGFPAGFFSLLQGDTIEVGQTLIQHPLLEAVGFTGSLRAGRAIFDTAAARPKPIPVYAEMGSINPVVLLPGAILARMEAIAEGLVTSVTLGTGQFCTNPGLVLVIDNPETQLFIELVESKMESRAPGVLLNASIERGLVKAVAETTRHAAVQTLTGATATQAEGYCYPNTVLITHAQDFRADPTLQNEHFGPVTMFVICENETDLLETIPTLHGNLTATIHAEESEMGAARDVFDLLREKAGRLILNGFPTGVAVVHSMQHGGPYPATTAPATTSVGMTAIKRFLRPVAFQNLPDTLLPEALKNDNPLNIWRVVDNQQSNAPIVKS
ncbi:MAG: 2,5-dioxovalerate dehydrogenase [Chloroflexota bacterium]|nr:aldehyde dehydrogenase (NADP(+)) [Chloroflexota bacterium]NOG62905.1 aldehyde dehydrogenase (NADP(+)) [Chloroflexota bacterium]GIK63562.1 MAG: 2,5-dioxovalerate dehydrogenase [Chloroflexota bacterium]